MTYVYNSNTLFIYIHTMAVITARVDDEIKAGLEEFSAEVGTSVSGLINMRARKLLKTRKFEVWFGPKVDYHEVNEPMEDVLSQMLAVQWKNG